MHAVDEREPARVFWSPRIEPPLVQPRGASRNPVSTRLPAPPVTRNTNGCIHDQLRSCSVCVRGLLLLLWKHDPRPPPPPLHLSNVQALASSRSAVLRTACLRVSWTRRWGRQSFRLLTRLVRFPYRLDFLTAHVLDLAGCVCHGCFSCRCSGISCGIVLLLHVEEQ